jgi:NAD+ synthase (glutamine-hydrolysing)
LTLSGYSIEDILLQDVLLDTVEKAVLDIVAASTDLLPVLVVGAPLRYRHRIYNTAVVIHRGTVLGVAPKSYLPTYREFYERRQMAAGDDERGTVRIGGTEVPFGADLLFAASDLPGFVLHIEICEDMFVPVPPSAEAALAGATVLANMSGSPITIGRADDRSLLARSASLRCLAAYVYAAAGEGESTQHRRRRHRVASRGTAADGHLRRQPTPPPQCGGHVPAHRISAGPAGRRHRPVPRG